MTAYYWTGALVWYLAVFAQITNRGTLPREAEDDRRTGSSWVFAIAAGLVLTLVSGLRWSVGSDYWSYARNYDYYKDTFLDDLISYNEPGIKGLAIISSWIRDDYATMIFLGALITIGTMVWTIAKHTNAFVFSILLFILAGSWHGSFNGIRQYLACAIIFAGHRYIVDRKIWKYAAVVLFASLFHISALAMALVYLVPRRRLGPVAILVTLALSVAALYSSDAVLSIVEAVKGEELTTPYVTSSINPLRIAVAVAPLALYALHRTQEEDRPEDWFYRNMALVHAAVMVTVSWSAYLGRFGIFTTAFIPLIFPVLVSFKDRQLTAFARFGVLVFFAIYWYVDVSQSPVLNDFRWIFERPF